MERVQVKGLWGMKTDDEGLATSWTLVTRLKNPGDEGSWQQFYELYRGIIIGVAAKAGLRPGEQEEVVQETMASVAKHIREFEGDPKRGSFRGWLLQMARWRIVDQFRKRMPVAAHEGALADATATTPTVERIPDPRSVDLESLCDAEWREQIRERALTELQRQVKAESYQAFFMVAVENRPVAHVARMLGRNPAWVYVVKCRLARKLRQIAMQLERRWG